MHAANLLARHALSGILADHRAMTSASGAADCNWPLTEWRPQAAAVRYAVLVNANPVRRLHTAAVGLQGLRRYAAA